ncbi:hypothetical protein C7T94_10695 [Pedobacter yulinensis]|uniref:Uncharacterized protein n=1 Tax=Pedobacter yulinensis TaxID=2126353 RepID=A0A2T3HKV5_9SPHI|nr:hypothetical protein C7T94_10695 [Pedobacter yulinensis]
MSACMACKRSLGAGAPWRTLRAAAKAWLACTVAVLQIKVRFARVDCLVLANYCMILPLFDFGDLILSNIFNFIVNAIPPV